MKRIVPLENFSIDGVMHHEGDTLTVEDTVAEEACKNGWAKDPSGIIPTGERDPTAKKLEVGKVAHGVAVSKAGG